MFSIGANGQQIRLEHWTFTPVIRVNHDVLGIEKTLSTRVGRTTRSTDATCCSVICDRGDRFCNVSMYAGHGRIPTLQPAIREAVIRPFCPIIITASVAIAGARVLEPRRGYASEPCQPPGEYNDPESDRPMLHSTASQSSSFVSRPIRDLARSLIGPTGGRDAQQMAQASRRAAAFIASRADVSLRRMGARRCPLPGHPLDERATDLGAT